MTETVLSKNDLDMILASIAPAGEQMRGQRLFLTGGTGFFGCWLVESFCHANRSLQLGARATILTRDPERFSRKCPHLAADPAITLLRGDVRDFQFPEGEFRFVIHAATETRSTPDFAEAPLKMLSTIIAGTERTLEFAATHGTRAFLLTSSGAVYGRQPCDLTHLPETYTGAPDPLDPASVYAEGKRDTEHCAPFTPPEPVSHAKLPAAGPSAAPSPPRRALRHRQLHWRCARWPANRNQRRRNAPPLLSLCCRSRNLAMDHPVSRTLSEPFNVGSANDVSILELAQTVANAKSKYRNSSRTAAPPEPRSPAMCLASTGQVNY